MLNRIMKKFFYNTVPFEFKKVFKHIFRYESLIFYLYVSVLSFVFVSLIFIHLTMALTSLQSDVQLQQDILSESINNIVLLGYKYRHLLEINEDIERLIQEKETVCFYQSIARDTLTLLVAIMVCALKFC